jgi:tripartite-type tricarboxylate transporter receptor subunit TctC
MFSRLTSLPRLTALGALAVSFAAAAPAVAQQAAWPARMPIRLVVTYAPGGGADTMARLIAPKVGQILGQTVVVENRPGGSGQIAAANVARSAPDGYTFMVDAASFSTNPSLFKKLPYDTARDFTPVSVLARFPNMLVVTPNLPQKNVQELIQAIRTKPESLAYASSGNGSAQHLAGALFAQRLKLELLHVPYKGGGPAMTDVMAGQVPIFFANTASGLQHVKSGKLRALAVTGATRVGALPQVPTLIESGVPDYEVYEWNPVLAPAGTPADIVAKMSDAIAQTLRSPDVTKQIEELGGRVDAMSPAQAKTFIGAEMQRWDGVIKAANIQLD